MYSIRRPVDTLHFTHGEITEDDHTAGFSLIQGKKRERLESVCVRGGGGSGCVVYGRTEGCTLHSAH